VPAGKVGARVLYIKAGVLGDVLRGSRVVFAKTFQVVLDLDAHDQVRTAFEVQSQVNVFGQRGSYAGRSEIFQMGTSSMRSNHDVKTYHGYDRNDDGTLKQILLLHETLFVMLLLFFRIDSCDGRSGDLQKDRKSTRL